MAKGSNLAGRWGNGAPKQSVTRTGFVESTVTEPRARPDPPEKAPLLKYYSDPWFTREPFNPAFKNVYANAQDWPVGRENLRISEAHNAEPQTKIRTLPPFK